MSNRAIKFQRRKNVVLFVFVLTGGWEYKVLFINISILYSLQNSPARTDGDGEEFHRKVVKSLLSHYDNGLF